VVTPAFLAAYGLTLCGPIALTAVWNRHVAAIGARPTYSFAWDRVRAQILSSSFGEQFVTVSTQFAAALGGRNPSPSEELGMWIPGWLAIMAGLAIFSVAAQKTVEQRARALSMQLVMACGLCAYIAFLYCFYVLALDFYEAVRLLSFGRYIGSFFLAWGFVSLAIFAIPMADDAKANGSRAIALLLLAGATVFAARADWLACLQHGFRGDSYSVYMMRIRGNVRARLGDFSQTIPADGRVYSLWNGTTGLSHYISLFELSPRRMNPTLFSLGEARFEGDVWSKDWTPSEFRDVLKSFDFVLLGEADEKFWSRYGELFAEGSRDSSAAFFRVDNSTERGLLYPVEGPNAGQTR
jgi:hypothetical protein